jgi:hypothetical protein
VAIYLVAASIGIASALLALVFPLWLRGGTQAIRDQAGRIGRVMVWVVAVVIVVLIANAAGTERAVNITLGAVSVGVAASLIYVSTKLGSRRGRTWLRGLAALAGFVSVLVLLSSLANP